MFSSAGIMAELGMPPICTSIGDMEWQRQTLLSWREAAERAGTTTGGLSFPLMINCIIADTDDAAVKEAQEFMPRFMKAQVDHYTVHATDWSVNERRSSTSYEDCFSSVGLSFRRGGASSRYTWTN